MVDIEPDIPCYADETLPKGYDIPIPRVGRKFYGVAPRTPIVHVQNIVEDRIRVSGLIFVCPLGNRLFNLDPNTLFFLFIFKCVVAFG